MQLILPDENTKFRNLLVERNLSWKKKKFYFFDQEPSTDTTLRTLLLRKNQLDQENKNIIFQVNYQVRSQFEIENLQKS